MFLFSSSEKAGIVGVRSKRNRSNFALKDQLIELGHLGSGVGYDISKAFVYNPREIHPGTLIRSGSVKELRYRRDLNHIIFNRPLTPTQQRNLNDKLPQNIIDRNNIILTIFEKRAQTRAAQIQVELARLRYKRTRTRGWGEALEKQEGITGARGPGETKREKQKRNWNKQIKRLKKERKQLREQRNLERKRRNTMPTAAIVGYTNAGKSTLLNALADADADVNNHMFCTLDTLTRRVHLGHKHYSLVTDTLGFIQNMPDTIEKAFAATFEEAGFADLLIHTIDLSSRRVDKKIRSGLRTLARFDLYDKKQIIVFNKVDCVKEEKKEKFAQKYPKSIFVSAKKKQGIDFFRSQLENAFYGAAEQSKSF